MARNKNGWKRYHFHIYCIKIISVYERKFSYRFHPSLLFHKKGIQSIIGIQSTILVESDLYFTLEVELVRPITFA